MEQAGDKSAPGCIARCLLGILCSESGVSLKTDSIDADESLSISRVVVKGFTTSLNVHGGQISVVQSLGAGSSLDGTVTLVELDFNLSDHIALGKVERVADKFHLGREPESVVAQAGEFVRHALGDSLDLTIHANSFQVHVRSSQQGTSRCLVDPTRLDSDETVLDDIDASNSVLSGNGVAVQENIQRIGLDGSVGLVGDLGGGPLDEFDNNGFGSVGGGLGRDGHLEHGVLGTASGIFEASRFVGGVEKIFVDRVVGLGLGIDGDGVFLAVGQQILSSLEGFDEFGVTPRGDTSDGRGKSLGAHFESNLIVTLSGGSVGDVLGTLFGGNSDHFLGDARSGNRGTEKVSAFVDGIRFDAVENVIGNEFLSQVSDDALTGADSEGLGFNGREVFLELTNVGAEGDDVESLFAQPFENNGGIETTRVGEDELRFGIGHGCKFLLVD